MRLSIDSDVLVYAVDTRDRRQPAAARILLLAAEAESVLTLQSLGEFFIAATRKQKVSAVEAMAEIARWRRIFPPPLVANRACLDIAMAASSAGLFGFWDAMLLATADAAGCGALISEDMAHGARLGGVRAVRAFDGSAVSPEALALLA